MKYLVFFALFFCVTVSLSQSLKEIDSLNIVFNRNINSNFKEAEKIALLQLKLSETQNNQASLLLSYCNLSEIYLYKKNNDLSCLYSNKALDIALKNDDFKALSTIYNRMSLIELRKENYIESLNYNEQSLKLAEENNLISQISDVYFNRALIYQKRIDSIKSYSSLKKSIKIRDENNFKIKLAESYNLYGNFIKDTKLDTAIYYFEKAIKIVEKTKNKYLLSYLSSNLGSTLLYAKNYPKALKALKRAEKLSNEVGNFTTLHYVNIYLGYYYEDIDDYDKALYHYEKAINTYGEYVDEFQLAGAYRLVSTAYYHTKKYELAYDYQNVYIYLADSILDIKKTKEFDALRTKFDVEKKNNQITLLKTENKLAATKRKWLIISTILLALPLIGLFLFYKHRAKTLRKIRVQEKEIHKKEKLRLQKEQELAKVKALIEGQDKERHRIAKELHDGVGGQLASVNMGLTHINSALNNQEIKTISTTLSKTFNELRDLSHNLSESYHKERTIESLLAVLKKQYENSNTFIIEVSIYPVDCLNNLDLNIKHNLYRALQELLNNCSKYAQADLVQISFNLHDSILVMMVEDNGVGFDVKHQKSGIGLKNIKERISSIDGKIIIESTRDIGTHIIIEIPLKTIN